VNGVRVVPDREHLARAAAAEIMSRAQAAARARGRFAMALAGGSTPLPLYALLAQEPYRSTVPWNVTHVFWGDERVVPADHRDSNFGMANEALLRPLGLPEANAHRIPAELGPEAAAVAYEHALRAFFQLSERELPRFDLLLLGLGADGHTASLFPRSPALRETKRLAAAVWVEPLQSRRITLTVPVLNQARCVVFLVAGRDKADVLRRVLRGTCEPEDCPARLIRPEQGELLWLVDEEAGGGYRLPSDSAR
jgi:6-phosphogluconolactonase